jgi:hypothetical protein
MCSIHHKSAYKATATIKIQKRAPEVDSYPPSSRTYPSPVVRHHQHGLLPQSIAKGSSSHHKQNALFNSALRQSTSIRKDLDQFADTAAPSPHLQAQLNASLTTFARTIDDYGKLAKQEPVQTKQEKAFERLKNFKIELEEYRDSFKRIKSANEDVVCSCINSRSERY